MKPVPISKAKAELSRLIARACEGEEVVIARGKTPLVKLVPISQRVPRRQFGALKGKVHLDDSFFEPLSREELRLWYGEAPKKER